MSRYLALALVFVAAGAVQAADKTLDRTFKVSPGGTLTVVADAGEVRVKAGDTNQVVVHMVFSGSEKQLARTTLEAVQSDTGVSVTMKSGNNNNWFSWGDSGDQLIEVTVPRSYGVNVRTGGGSVDLRDTAGAAILRTSGGDVRAKNVTGNLELRTSGGSIEADSIKGDVDADTSGGDIRVRVDGKIKAHTSGGSVRVSLLGANRGISASTSGGDVEVRLPRGTAGNVEARTSGGDVESELPVTTTKWKDSSLEGTLNGGGERIYAHTSGGSIRLRAEN
jgi:hypothetical protein